MIAFLHGVAGGWDELAIAVGALGVLWVAVKLAGRKAGAEDDDSEEAEKIEETNKIEEDEAEPRPTPPRT